MAETRISPDDPRLTAYALGELDEAERAKIERELAASPELAAAVEDLRRFTERLAAELTAEPVPELTVAQRAKLAGAAVVAPAEPMATAKNRRRPRSRYIALMATGVTVLTAGLLAMFVGPTIGRNQEADQTPLRAFGLHLGNYDPSDSQNAEFADDLAALSPDDRNLHRPDGTEHKYWDASIDGVSAGGVPATAPSTRFTISESMTEGVANGSRQSGERGAALGVGQFGGSPAHSYLEDSEGRSVGGKSPGTNRGREVSDRLRTGSRALPGDVSREESRLRRSESAPLSGSQDRYNKLAQTDPAATPPPSQTASEPQSSAPGRPNDSPATAAGGQPAPTPTPDANQSAQTQEGFGLDGSAPEPVTGEAYNPIIENDYLTPRTDPLSTFSIDVDTASYSNVRRFLNHGQWPPADAVRIEELVNYFHYDYPEPEGEHPFSVALEAAACPWNPDHRLVRIGLEGKDYDREQRPPSNLVFLIDVSGSMRDPNKLPLVKDSLLKLVDQMTEDDRIAIATYAGSAGLQLESTSGQHRDTIVGAINSLQAGGSTNGEAGIKLAYDTAIQHFYKGGANRVILCTDGDFNVGISDGNQLVQMITEKAKSGVFLSIFGFGMGNLKDAKLEQLADKGNGHYAYIDDQREAYKVFGEELTGTLYTIAKDVKIQVEFNPARVGAYRLIGYENRALAAQDFNDDTKDAGEIGAGHRVTALYEIVPPEKLAEQPAGVEPLKYQQPKKADVPDGPASRELLTVKLRYKLPDEDQSTRLEFPLVDPANPKAMPSQEFEFAAAVAAFGMILRDSQYRGQADLNLVQELARGNQGDDPNGHRREFLELVEKAKALQPNR